MCNVLAKARIGGKFSTFHPFERLPIELQNIIWEFSIEPRFVLHRERDIRSKRNRKGTLEEVDDSEIYHDDLPSDELPFWPREYSHHIVIDWITIPGCRHTPAILHVSKKAREVGLRHYKAQKSLQVILQEHDPPRFHNRLKGRAQFNLNSSKSMYLSQKHDLRCWESYFYYNKVYEPLPIMSVDVRDFIHGFLHQLVTLRTYNRFKFRERFVPEDFIGDEKSPRKERATFIIDMSPNVDNDSPMDRREEFRQLVKELRGSKQVVMPYFDAAGIQNYRTINLKYSRFGFCKECLKATEDVAIEADMEANLETWAKPKHLRKELRKLKGSILHNKCKSSCDLTWGIPYYNTAVGRLVRYGVLILSIPLIPFLL
ncbi:3876c469-062e-4e24-a82c-50320caaba1b [Sclerotinia trifoliorum]|uniref:3876c469-062e-4e24-a82c-50320caaba1b n=1 Tax=Sclerotinia trifoliorum TaxID=28548 RepID=A0A8H2W1T0_9HELO|nr:3876c469-062e-4e24-a82c-50320caaba1b [Sclerotinia trifoliorum]